MHKITFKIEGGEDVTVFAALGESILSVARSAGIAIDAPCSGSGTCGKCRVRLLEGSVGFDGSRHITDEEMSEGWRLACVSTVSADAVMLIPGLAELSIPVRPEGFELLMQHLAASGIKRCSPAEAGYVPAGAIYGAALDIGTTTVSGLLVDLQTGEILASSDAGNSQIRYGADVIHRIIEQSKPGGIERMQDSIVNDTLLPLIDDMCAHAGIPRSRIHRMTVASNTTMNHLLLGVDATPIRMEPYVPAFLEMEPFDSSQIGIELAPSAKIHLAPNIGSYVGGDITAGILASMIWNDPDYSVFIDLGTNGEIVFGNNEFLMACACSAGPAFEGGDISCGMRAARGAIEACAIDESTMEPTLTVIGSGKPRGLCGSGLIDVVAELFRNKIINGKGRFIREGARICRDEYGTGSFVLAYAKDSATGRDISVSEVDLDNFIRAKGAVFSALLSLMTPLSIVPADIEHIIIAGGIGSGINIKNAISIGMLPALPEEKYSYIGNSSLSGAYAALVSEDAERRIHEIASGMTYIELSTQPGYMDAFVAACFLPHTDGTLFAGIS